MRLFKEAGIYLVSGGLNRLAPFLLLPLLTRSLSTADFGLVSLFQVALSFLTATLGSGLQLNIPRTFFVWTRERFAAHLFNVLLVLVASATIFLALALATAALTRDFFGIPDRWLVALPILAGMSMLNLLNLTLLRCEQRPVAYGVVEVSSTALNLLLSIVLVAYFSLGWEGRAASIAIPTVLYGVVALWHLRSRSYLAAEPSRESVREIVAFSLPLMPHALAAVVISVSDRFFLAALRGSEEVGIYSVGYSFGMVVMLFTDAFAKAWSPWLLRSMATATEADRRGAVRITYLYLLALVVGTTVYAWLAVRLLPLVVGPEFVAASRYIPWVCAGYVAFGIYQVFFPYLVLMSQTKFLAFSSVLAAAANLIANYVLIRSHGAIGAAWATILSYCISAALVGGFVIRRYPMPWLTAFARPAAPSP